MAGMYFFDKMRKHRPVLRNMMLASAFVVLAAAGTACGSKADTASAAETTAAEAKESTELVPAETTTQDAQETAASSVAEQVPEGGGKLTEILSDIRENYAEGAAGISLRAASRAASLMEWYVKTKPSGDSIMRETEKFTNATADKKSFAIAVQRIYDSAKETAGEGGKSLLADAGYTGEITWTKDDVDHLFNAIFEGTGQQK